ncbi:MAG: hypothetical protein NTW96_24730 [Planctomycetia bacterium]|nr:hypothetical protein [Planctomycetia bacterium]
MTTIRIIDHVLDTDRTVEIDRPAEDLFDDLGVIVRRANRKDNELLRGAVCRRDDTITVHWHCPADDDTFARCVLRVAEPVRAADELAREGKVSP